MSRIGKQLISIPEGVELKLDGNHLEVKGKKGTLKRELHATMSLLVDKTAKTKIRVCVLLVAHQQPVQWH